MANTFHLQIVTPMGWLLMERTESHRQDSLRRCGHFKRTRRLFCSHQRRAHPRVKTPMAATARRRSTAGSCRVTKEVTRVVATSFEWADQIDLERAQRANPARERRWLLPLTPARRWNC